MEYFKLPKKDILFLYVRELPLILNRIKLQRRNDTLDRLNDKLIMLQFMTITAGMAPNIDAINEMRNSINDQINKLSYVRNDTETVAEDPYEALKNLQLKMANARKR